MRRRDRAGIAQSLRRHPVLTVGAVKVATEHSKTVGESAGMRMEKRLLLNGVALGSGGISPGYEERAAAIVADLAHAGLAFGNGTAMSASEAAHAVILELLVKMGISLANALVENGAEGGHFLILPLWVSKQLPAYECRPAAFGFRRPIC